MKIALISANATPVASDGGEPEGPARYVANLARGLGAAGHRVDVFTRRSDLWAPATLDIGANARVINVPAGPPRFVPAEALLPCMDDFAARVASACAHGGRYDVAHASAFLSGIAALRLKKHAGVSFVITLHDPDRVRQRQGFDPFPAERRRIEAQLAAAADRLIALDWQERQDLIALYETDADRIEVIPPGVDAADFGPAPRRARSSLGLHDGEFVILQVARLVADQGTQTVIRALALLRRDFGARARLLVICDDDDPDPLRPTVIGQLRALAAAEGVAEHITFLDPRPRAALRDLCAAGNAVVAPSCESAESVLEAMAFGLPVVGSDRGRRLSAVCDQATGYVVAPGDAAALADRLGRLHRNPELARAYGRGAILRVRSAFTWHHVATAVACVYAGVLAPHRARLAAAASGC